LGENWGKNVRRVGSIAYTASMSDDYRRTLIGPTAEPTVEQQSIQRAEQHAAAVEVIQPTLRMRVAWVLQQPLFWLGVVATALVALVLAVVVLAAKKSVLPAAAA
jgi:hypothetical protein